MLTSHADSRRVSQVWPFRFGWKECGGVSGQLIEFLLTAVQTAATGEMKQGMKETGNWKAAEISLWAQFRESSDREQEAISPLTEQSLSFILLIFRTTISRGPSIAHFLDPGDKFTGVINGKLGTGKHKVSTVVRTVFLPFVCASFVMFYVANIIKRSEKSVCIDKITPIISISYLNIHTKSDFATKIQHVNM